MALPIFTINLNQKLLSGRVTIGKYDGTHSCITAATTADKVLVHSPHKRVGLAMGRAVQSDANKETSLLNINQTISSICAGQLNPSDDRDMLLVGTPTNLLAYDIANNIDVFYKEVPDGASVIVIGKLGRRKKPLVIVGGNCSLQGFEFDGSDPFWTVTGDNVCSLALLDYDYDGENELVVGSEDYDIRVFKDDNIISEQTETEAVVALTAFQGNKFGYGLANGTVGVYERLQRLWRVKSKNCAVAIYGYDLNGDGVEELITGWSNGKIDARSSRTGEVIYKDNLNHPIAGIVEGDYRMVGQNDLICCSIEGEVRGYNMTRQMSVNPTPLTGGSVNMEAEAIHELFTKKQSLLLELRNYEGNSQFAEIGTEAVGQELAELNENVGIIPAQTRLQTGIAINMGTDKKPPHVEISLSTNNETVIRAVMVFAEGIFKGETLVLHPKDSEVSSKLDVALYPPKDVSVDIHIKALVGYERSKHFHVFELTKQLPKFSMYALLVERTQTTDCSVSFVIRERLQRIAMWINHNFLLIQDYEASTELDITFLSLRDNVEITLHMETNGNVLITTSSMSLAGDIIQSLAHYVNVKDLQVNASFPEEEKKVGELLQKIADLQDVRQKLQTEMADHSGLIRSLVVRAEDSRQLEDMKSLRKWYSELNDLNTDLIRGYNIRCQNHKELLDALKELNIIIQKAARLRVGKYKTYIVNYSRLALKNNNVHSLVKLIQCGKH